MDIICLDDDSRQFVVNNIRPRPYFCSRASITRKYLKVKQNVRESLRDIQQRLSKSFTWRTRNVEQNGTGQVCLTHFLTIRTTGIHVSRVIKAKNKADTVRTDKTCFFVASWTGDVLFIRGGW